MRFTIRRVDESGKRDLRVLEVGDMAGPGGWDDGEHRPLQVICSVCCKW